MEAEGWESASGTEQGSGQGCLKSPLSELGCCQA